MLIFKYCDEFKNNDIMQKLKLFFALLMLIAFSVGNVWADPTLLFHETFGNKTSNGTQNFTKDLGVQSGVSAVYSDVAYTITNAKQSKNTTGQAQSPLMQTTKATDAVFEFGPLHVSSYSSLVLTYYWKAASTNGTYSTSVYYKTSSTGTYNSVTKTSGSNGATTFQLETFNLPGAAQVNTLYLKIVWNTSNTQGLIDEVDLKGVAGSSNPTLSAAPSPANSGTVVIKNSSNETVESGSEFEYGDEFTLTATPEEGYKFVYWSLSDGTDADLFDNDEVANNEDEKNPVGIIVGEETTTVTAHFAQPAEVETSSITCTGASFDISESNGRDNYIVYTSSSTDTPMSLTSTWTAKKNGNGTITISSGLSKNTTYYYWCASEVASGHYVYTDKKNFTTANNFDLDLTLADGKGNTVSASSYTCIASGTSVTLTASPASGYVVSGWTVLDGSSDAITPTATTATTFTFNMPASNVTAEAIFQQQVAAPSFSPAAGTYSAAQNVTITSTEGATIYYTTNGDEPTTSSTPYASAISVSSNQTIKAIAVKAGMANSAVSTAAYSIKCATPEISLTTGTYTGAQTVTITVPTGATVYYTTDGSTPDNTKTEYTGAINVATGMTIKAIAIKDGMANSDVASATYTIQYTVTWKVNGVALSGVALGDATVLVTAGGKVSKLPTDPDPSDYCGQRFMGWTNSDMGSTLGQSAPGVLFKTAASAPAVNETTTYHAVFADYAE